MEREYHFDCVEIGGSYGFKQLAHFTQLVDHLWSTRIRHPCSHARPADHIFLMPTLGKALSLSLVHV